MLGFALIGVGAALRDQHLYQEAVASLFEGLLIHASLGSREGVADALDDLAPIVADRGNPGSAAMMLGAAEALREEIGMTLAPVTTTWRPGITRRIRSGLDDKTYDVRWKQGRALNIDQVVDHVDAWVQPYAGDVADRREAGGWVRIVTRLGRGGSSPLQRMHGSRSGGRLSAFSGRLTRCLPPAPNGGRWERHAES